MIETLTAGWPVVVVVPVAWGEMDSYRHVNNVVYFRYFENARIEYMRRLDWFAQEAQTHVGVILQSVQARFRRPLTYPDTVSVTARLHSIEADRFTLEHVVISHHQGVVTTEGRGTLVSYHYREHRKVPIPDELRRRIMALEGRSV